MGMTKRDMTEREVIAKMMDNGFTAEDIVRIIADEEKARRDKTSAEAVLKETKDAAIEAFMNYAIKVAEVKFNAEIANMDALKESLEEIFDDEFTSLIKGVLEADKLFSKINEISSSLTNTQKSNKPNVKIATELPDKDKKSIEDFIMTLIG